MREDRKVFKEIWKRKTFFLVSFIFLYPLWIWPCAGLILRFLLKDTSPGMSPQDKDLVIAWNAFIDLFFLQAHPDIVEAYVDAKVYYRFAGRPDLASRAAFIGGILLWWGFLAKIYALFGFPILLVYPYRDKEKGWKLVLAMIFVYLVYLIVYITPFIIYRIF